MQNPMDHKLTLLTANLPKAMLQALTPQTLEAIPSHLLRGDLVAIYAFPFRVGRESRVVEINGKLVRMERPGKDDTTPTNDLYLVDRGHLLNISRDHFHILRSAAGYMLVDQGSACGTKIDGRNIGGSDAGGVAELPDGAVIAVGTADTPYVFRFLSFDEYQVVRTVK
jgi:hypothetical protein